MTELSPAVLSQALAERWGRWTHASHRYVLPTAAAAGLALGGALAVGAPLTLSEYAPAALLTLGSVSLGSSLLYLGWKRHSDRPGPSGSRVTVRAPAVPCPRCVESDARREWGDLVRRAWHTAVPDPLEASPLEGPWTPRPGDQLWETWSHEEGGRLPVALVGPVPETAWTRPSAGAFVPFPEKEPTLIVIDGILSPVPSPQGNSPPAGPTVLPGTERAGPEGTVPDSPDDQRTLDDPAGPAPLTYGFDLGQLAPSLDWLTLEALHPVPPHLRGPTDPTWSSSATPQGPIASEELSETCGSCLQSFPEDAGGGWCPECGVPVCHGCRARAIVDFGHTWCVTCGASRAWELPFAQVPSAPADAGPWPPAASSSFLG